MQAGAEMGYEEKDINGEDQIGICLNYQEGSNKLPTDETIIFENNIFQFYFIIIKIYMYYKGFSRMQSTIKNGARHSTYWAYLKPAMERSNLHVSVDSFVTKVRLFYLNTLKVV